MNAKQARQSTITVIENLTSNELGDIMLDIEEAIEEGKFQCFFYGDMMETVKTELEKDGYKVEQTTQRNETEYRIEW